MRGRDTQHTPVAIPADAFLRATGQMWKLRLAPLVPWPALVVGFRALRNIGAGQSTREYLADVAVIGATAAMLLILMASIRCPRCRVRLFGLALWSRERLDGLVALLNSTACTACGFVPGSREDSHGI